MDRNEEQCESTVFLLSFLFCEMKRNTGKNLQETKENSGMLKLRAYEFLVIKNK